MESKDTERLARVEQKVTDLKETTESNFKSLRKITDDNNTALNKKLDEFIERADNTFLTVAQAKLVAWFVGLVMTVVGLILLAWNHVSSVGR